VGGTVGPPLREPAPRHDHDQTPAGLEKRKNLAWKGVKVMRSKRLVLMLVCLCWLTTRQEMGVLRRSHRSTLETIRGPLAAFGAVVKRDGNRCLVDRMSVERYLRSHTATPIAPKVCTKSIWLRRAKRRGGDGAATE
jgi:hypothetical protein